MPAQKMRYQLAHLRKLLQEFIDFFLSHPAFPPNSRADS
jgi:hypothetical protein